MNATNPSLQNPDQTLSFTLKFTEGREYECEGQSKQDVRLIVAVAEAIVDKQNLYDIKLVCSSELALQNRPFKQFCLVWHLSRMTQDRPAGPIPHSVAMSSASCIPIRAVTRGRTYVVSRWATWVNS